MVTTILFPKKNLLAQLHFQYSTQQTTLDSKMADDEEDIEEEEVQGPPPSKLVFVNHVDSYTGSSVAKVGL